MSMRVRVTKNKFPQVIFTTAIQGKLVARDVAEDVQQNAQHFVPVRFGFLRDSITMSGAGGSWEVWAQSTFGGADREYASYVEYGTSKMAAQPFMLPAAQKGANVDVWVAGREFGSDIRRAAR